jgi:hypothetical protein
MGKHQPALLGGLFIGVLSSLPFVNLANCCCLWVLAGGVLVVYLQQQNTPMPVETSDAAIGGLIAGAVGGVLFCLVQAVIMRASGPLVLEQIRSQMGTRQDVPPEAMAFMERLFTGRGFLLLMFALAVPVYAIFAMLGSLLGLVFFRKKQPPQAPPVQA